MEDITLANLERQRMDENRRLAEQQQREYEEAVEADRRMVCMGSK